MPDRPRFGPAGIPNWFKKLNIPISELPHMLKEEKLDALEYEAVRWGKKPQMKKEEAERLGVKAEESDVWLSMHGSYYINLLSDNEILDASKKRLLACVTAANWMKAHTVVFHPGYYSKRQSRKNDLQDCMKTLEELSETIQSMGMRATLGPEVAGRHSQLGSLEEVLTICENVEQTQPVVDWGHLHARERGKLRTYDDFEQVIEIIERRIGTKVAKNLHCHFSLVEYTFRGERRHHSLDTPGFGPKFEFLAEVVAKRGLTPVIISESPLLDQDARKMRSMVCERLETIQELR